MELFKKINEEQKKTVIQVTHSSEASRYGKRIIRVKDGKIEG
jgi:putative ABC transport system ATP-binding protein